MIYIRSAEVSISFVTEGKNPDTSDASELPAPPAAVRLHPRVIIRNESAKSEVSMRSWRLVSTAAASTRSLRPGANSTLWPFGSPVDHSTRTLGAKRSKGSGKLVKSGMESDVLDAGHLLRRLGPISGFLTNEYSPLSYRKGLAGLPL